MKHVHFDIIYINTLDVSLARVNIYTYLHIYLHIFTNIYRLT